MYVSFHYSCPSFVLFFIYLFIYVFFIPTVAFSQILSSLTDTAWVFLNYNYDLETQLGWISKYDYAEAELISYS